MSESVIATCPVHPTKRVKFGIWRRSIVRSFQTASQMSLIVVFVIVRVIRFDLVLCIHHSSKKEEGDISKGIHVGISGDSLTHSAYRRVEVCVELKIKNGLNRCDHNGTTRTESIFNATLSVIEFTVIESERVRSLTCRIPEHIALRPESLLRLVYGMFSFAWNSSPSRVHSTTTSGFCVEVSVHTSRLHRS